jgi:Tol biopolymer transport system component
LSWSAMIARTSGGTGLHTVAARPGPCKDRANAAARRARTLLFAALLAAFFCPAPAAAQLPPDEDWRTFETPRFRVHFPARLEGLARRAASRAERSWDQLADLLPSEPGPRVDLVLTDHVDFSNGYASVTPRKLIVVYARPPVDVFGLAYFDDWMELVVTHELAHVFHLDVTGALGRVLRAVFGRVPASWPFFPELDTPRWVSEGLAVYYETALSESGRGEGTYHDMVLRTAALEDRFESIDQTSGGSPVWPGGERVYIYGSTFFEWLLARHGPEKMGDLVEAIGGQWIPYRLNSAARRAFGVSFSSEWRVWTAEVRQNSERLRAELARRAPLTATEPITRGARYTIQPQVSPDGTRLAFVRGDGLSDPQIRVTDADGSNSRQLARTNGAPFFSWAPDGSIVLAQLEFDGPFRLPSDLYRLDASGRSTRITRGARLDHPAVTRDGRTAFAIQNRDGTTDLVRVDLQTGDVAPIVPLRSADVHWAFPSPSPDGRWLAAVRWTRGRSFDLVLLGGDGAGGWAVVREITGDRAVEQWPTWSPDGRWLLWGSDRSGIQNVYAVAVGATGEVSPINQVTNLATGIVYPSVDPSGRWIYGSVYHSDGWDVERIAFDPARWFEPFPLAELYAPTTVAALPPPATEPAWPYSAAKTLAPKFWSPLVLEGELVSVPGRGDVEVLGPFIGLATAATDVLGKHTWAVEAALSTTDARFQGSVGYGYQGLGNPQISLFADQRWDASGPFTGRRSSGQIDTLFIRDRDRRIQLGSTFVLRRYRYGGSLGFSAAYVAEDSELLDRDLGSQTVYRLDTPTSRLGDARASLSLSTARSHSLGISVEEGASISLQGRVRRHLALADSLRSVTGADRSFSEGIGRVRLYQPLRALGLTRHVLAFRASGGVATGPGADRFHFEVGGASGAASQVASLSVLGGSSYSFPVRGYRTTDRYGRFAWSTTAEYRFPIVRVNRGIGLIPIHLDQVSGSLFADAGNAWGPELGPSNQRFHNPRRPALASAGVELAADVLAFFNVSLPLRGGVAFPTVDAAGRGTDPVWYLRLGPSF